MTAPSIPLLRKEGKEFTTNKKGELNGSPFSKTKLF